MIGIYRSVYSYKKSILKIEDIIKKAKEMNQKYFSITDYNSVTSFAKAFIKAEANDLVFIPGFDVSIKPIEEEFSYKVKTRIQFLEHELTLKRTTLEMGIEYDKELLELYKMKVVDCNSVKMLAINDQGLKNMFYIYSAQKNDYVEYLNDIEDIIDKSEGIIFIISGKTGESHKRKLIEAAKDRCFYSISPESSIEEVEENSKIIPLISTSNVLYQNKENRADYRLFAQIGDEVKEYSNCPEHALSDEELREILESKFSKKHVDQGFESHDSLISMIEKISAPKVKMEGTYDEKLKELVWEGWKNKRVGTDLEEDSKKRCEFELDIISSKGFSKYFIKVLSIVKKALELNILTGPARGSGAGSEICYLTGISGVDPIKYNLYFERFINPGRKDFPDIDLDFASNPIFNKYKQEDVLIEQKVGETEEEFYERCKELLENLKEQKI